MFRIRYGYLALCLCHHLGATVIVLLADGAGVSVAESSQKSPEIEERSCPDSEVCFSDKTDANSKALGTNVSGSIVAQCGVWVALSTLPGTGIGMFAGKDFAQDESLMSAGDHIIPIVDLPVHSGARPFFLWDEYTWNAKNMNCDNLGFSEVNVASSGFGATANSFMDFVNVEEWYPVHSVAHQLHRRKDPGAGAFTHYHSRHSTASKAILEGQELFVSYGSNWFKSRPHLGAIPVKGDHQRAESLYKRYREKIVDKQISSCTEETQEQMGKDLWESFVTNSSWVESRTIGALPPQKDYAMMLESGLVQMKESRMIRIKEWLQEHGVCADNMHIGESSIPQAGHGAFASRFLKNATILLPIPLIHIPNRDVLDMFEVKREGNLRLEADFKKPRPPQLLLNYCLGHRESTVLLSGYGPIFNLINHNQSRANVRLEWASPERSQHNPELLKSNVSSLEEYHSAQLAMELIALRDIQPNEEIFLDYGDEWETAWKEHIDKWEPVEGAETYKSAWQLNNETGHLLTEFEQMKTPYPSNVMLKFHKAFTEKKNWTEFLERPDHGKSKFQHFLDKGFGMGYVDAEILQREEVLSGHFFYTAVIPKDEYRKEWIVVKNVPRLAFSFQDRPYSSDIFLPNAFRHDIRIPDDMFPAQWKNAPQSTITMGS